MPSGLSFRASALASERECPTEKRNSARKSSTSRTDAHGVGARGRPSPVDDADEIMEGRVESTSGPIFELPDMMAMISAEQPVS